jgi:alkanesulfonate monooxygenase SsuD/methylene tetrahydromethanopterin reductase-like flavin-dependent oxidoreductase (luciferase family)
VERVLERFRIGSRTVHNITIDRRRDALERPGTLSGVRIGVVILPTDPWPETRALARRLDALGYDHLWTYDHLSWRHYRDRPWQAAIPWLTGMAAATDRIRLGPLVASPNFRHPVNLAKEAMTLDHVSSGRVVLGVGAGGPGFDATVLGGPAPSGAELAGRFEEFVTVLDELLREPAVSHSGRHYTVDDARMNPGCVQQPRVPLALAAGGPRTMALAARLADTWITHAGTLDGVDDEAKLDAKLRAQCDAMARACEAAGRDPVSLGRLYMVGFEPERPLRSTDAFAAFVSRMAALDFTDIVVHHPRADDPARDDPPEIIEQVASDVLPSLNA